MRLSKNLLLGLLLSLSISGICLAFSIGDGDGFNASRRDVLIRRIGHEVLLKSGDLTSRVLPVKKIADNEYQIRFEQEFAFLPDSLVKTTQRLLTDDYVVNVLNCNNSSVVYEYAISKDKKDDIIPCSGRKQPKACYTIVVKFKGGNKAKSGYLLGSLPLLAFVGFLFWRSVKPPRKVVVAEKSQDTDVITLGAVLFDAKNRKLVINDETMELTGTEARVMNVFALSPNETIERSRLQKEIWEDEGVIVGRSLDMFISKLRKKLESDPDINIVVVRGKGYKLEINADNFSA